jgi:hypothetical protein
VLVIAAPVALIALVDWYQTFDVTTDDRSLQVFRNGYLLAGNTWGCEAYSTRGERFALSVLVSTAFGLLCALAAYPIRRWVDPWRALRWAGLVTFAWFVCASLLCPRSSLTWDPERQGILLVRSWKPLVGDITLPFISETTIKLTAEHAWVDELYIDGTTHRFFLSNGSTQDAVVTSPCTPVQAQEALGFLTKALPTQ